MPTPEQVETLIDLSLAALLVVGGWREWYVWGPAHRRQLAEKSEDVKFWRDLALRSANVAEKAVDAVPGQRDG